jgi:hypothetical protein
MVKLFFFLAVALLAVGAPSPASATALVEPYLGYFDGSYKNPSNTRYDISGLTFGGRLGIDSYMFSFGLDYLTGKWQDDHHPKNDATPSHLGAFVGYQAIPMLRFYFVYAFDAVLRLENSNGSNKLEGKSMSLIMGISAFPMVNVNVEYMQATYDTSNGNSIPSGDYNLKMYGISLSVPLSL